MCHIFAVCILTACDVLEATIAYLSQRLSTLMILSGVITIAHSYNIVIFATITVMYVEIISLLLFAVRAEAA